MIFVLSLWVERVDRRIEDRTTMVDLCARVKGCHQLHALPNHSQMKSVFRSHHVLLLD